jgi:hypothetical protein
MNRNERTPRTLAETSFTTGYPVHEPRRGFREGVVAGLFLAFLFLALFGFHAVAVIFGG